MQIVILHHGSKLQRQARWIRPWLWVSRESQENNHHEGTSAEWFSSDTAPHAVLRWEEICQAVIEGISSPADRDMIHRYSSWTDVATDIQTKSADKQYNVSIRRMLRQVETVPRSLGNLTNSFLQAIEPNKVDLRIIWGLILLNIKVRVHSVTCMLVYLNAPSLPLYHTTS